MDKNRLYQWTELRPHLRLINRFRIAPQRCSWGPRTIDDYELIYVVSGRLFLHREGLQTVLNEGDVVNLHPDTEHFLFSKLEGLTEISCIHFSYHPDEPAPAELAMEALKQVSCKGDREVAAIFLDIFHEHQSGKSDASVMMDAMLTRLLIILHRKQKEGMSRRIFHRIQPVLDAIENRYQENLSRAELAKLIQVSEAQLTKLFNTYLGMSPIRYLNEVRLNRSKELLLEDALPISEVAYRCGYNDPLYFARAFRRIFQNSPSEYRQLHLHP